MLSFQLELAFSFCRLFVQLSRYWLWYLLGSFSVSIWFWSERFCIYFFLHHGSEFLLSTDKCITMFWSWALTSLLWVQGITTYEYVVALRAQTEQLGQSVDELDQTSQPPSPTSSAVTATSGRSSLGLSIQYRGASLCTPPNIFMDQQVKTKSNIFFTSFTSVILNLFPGRCYPAFGAWTCTIHYRSRHTFTEEATSASTSKDQSMEAGETRLKRSI